MKIASWNIAGIRARLPTLLPWLKENDFDIVCLQEIKAQDKDFPYEAFEDLGYHIETFGQKAFNGVAILAKNSPYEVRKNPFANEDDTQARFIEAVFNTKRGAIRICSLYAPNGNPVESTKFPYKIQWMKNFYTFAKECLSFEEPIIFAGDYNVIPEDKDAKNPEKWRKDALFQPETKEIFFKICHLGYQDAIRLVTQEPSYTFWDFQGRAFEKNDGIRIDHFLLSSQACDMLQNAYVQKHMRMKEKPSDHVPVILEINDNF